MNEVGQDLDCKGRFAQEFIPLHDPMTSLGEPIESCRV
jgi:hypothetical protein